MKSREEEKAKATKGGELPPAFSHEQKTPSETQNHSSFRKAAEGSEDASELRKEVMDLKIANREKDMFIEHLKTERENILGQLIESSRKVGELVTKLLQIDPPPSALT